MTRVMKHYLIVMIMLLLVLGCATFSRDSYRVLTVSYQSYDATLSTLGSLYKEGKISEEQKADVVLLAEAYKIAHNEAVDVLAKYEESGRQGNKDAVTSAISNTSAALARLIAYVRPFLEGG